MSAPMAACVAPEPPVSAMLALVSEGLLLYSVRPLYVVPELRGRRRRT